MTEIQKQETKLSKELKNGKLLVQGLLQGKSTITATSGNKVYKYKVIVHTNGFQRQKTTMYVNNKPFGAGKDVWQYEMSWDKIKDADGYIIYGVYRGNERAEKIKVIHNRNQVKWIYRTENYQAFNFFAIIHFLLLLQFLSECDGHFLRCHRQIPRIRQQKYLPRPS